MFDYTCVPHTALPYVHLGGDETPQKRQSVDLRFIGRRVVATPASLVSPTSPTSAGADATGGSGGGDSAIDSGDGDGDGDGRSTPGSDVEGWMANWMEGFDPAAAASSEDEDDDRSMQSRIRFRPGMQASKYTPVHLHSPTECIVIEDSDGML